MPSRRVFLTRALGASLLFPAIATACGIFANIEGNRGETSQTADRIKSATAIAQVFGDGQKLTAVAVEFDQDIDNSKLSTSTFKVDGSTITRVYANTAAAIADKGTNGKYAIMEQG
jgi:predicted peptidase